jgi:hypothetical protein
MTMSVSPGDLLRMPLYRCGQEIQVRKDLGLPAQLPVADKSKSRGPGRRCSSVGFLTLGVIIEFFWWSSARGALAG